MRRYSNEVEGSTIVAPTPTAPLSRSSSEEFVQEFAPWRAKKRRIKPEIVPLPSQLPSPPHQIALPICKSVNLQKYCWHLATLLIEADMDPSLIRAWQVKVGKRGGNRRVPHFIGHEGTVFRYSSLIFFSFFNSHPFLIHILSIIFSMYSHIDALLSVILLRYLSSSRRTSHPTRHPSRSRHLAKSL